MSVADAGRYECSARNERGHAHARATLTVLGEYAHARATLTVLAEYAHARATLTVLGEYAHASAKQVSI